MRLNTIVVQDGGVRTLESAATPSREWLTDRSIRWLNVEGAAGDELEQLFDQLGAEGSAIAGHINGEDWPDAVERDQYVINTHAAPTSWLEHEAWFHLVVLPGTVVTVHAVEIPAMDAFIQRWWLDRPGPDLDLGAVVLHVIQCFIEEELVAFHRIRLEVERHAEGLKRGDDAFSVEDLEALITKCHHMTMVFQEHQALFEGLEFLRSRVISVEACVPHYRNAARVIQSMMVRVVQVQRRLDGLQQQYLMDQQQRTDGRIRILTVVSVIILPLTLLAGIYGMNFENMPELSVGTAYYIVLGSMATLAIALVVFFLKKGWFR